MDTFTDKEILNLDTMTGNTFFWIYLVSVIFRLSIGFVRF